MTHFPTRTLLVSALALALAACQKSESPAEVSSAQPAPVTTTDQAVVAEALVPAPAESPLAAVLAAQPEEVQARYMHRHPAETLEFFGIEPGMTVVEALPGGGWYSKILAPYLGTEGTLVGADYNPAMFPLFGFYSEEQLKAKETWPDDWRAQAMGWFDAPVADIDAFQFGGLPERVTGEADAVLFIRALHNLARFEAQGGYLTAAIADAMAALKPSGVVGVVQHMAPEDAADAWADGSAGYIKKSFVVASFEAAGFELVGESDVNVNPKDQPTAEDIVWRLPPSLSGSRDNPELAAQMQAIGESTRMTLLFKKPE